MITFAVAAVPVVVIAAFEVSHISDSFPSTSVSD